MGNAIAYFAVPGAFKEPIVTVTVTTTFYNISENMSKL